MYNLRVLLLVNFIIVIYVPNVEMKETLYFEKYEPIEEQKAVDLLAEIQDNQVLPLVQMLNNVKMEFQYPERLKKVFIDKGRIINGTQFTSANIDQQLLFCPKKNSNDYCLVPTEFQGLEPLQCAKELTPLVREEQKFKLCGAHDSGKPYKVVYEICPTEELKDYKNRPVILYILCYNLNNQKPIFTSHIIEFPELLDSKALRHEHNIKYNMETEFSSIPSNLQHSSDAQTEELPNSLNTERQHENEDQYVYRMQKLTPPEDMAFASWRKSTYRYFNTELQHRALIQLWNQINDHIRNQAKKMYISERVKFLINTGVFDSNFAPREDGQKSNIWVKLICAIPENIDNPSLAPPGLVIMMNNFIDRTTEHTTSSKSTEKSIINYCKDDSCEDGLKKKFEEVGGRVRCCSVAEEMKEIINYRDDKDYSEDIHTPVPLLRIPGINDIAEDYSEETQSEGRKKMKRGESSIK